MQFFESGDFELYNLIDDIGETTDLSQSNPEKLEELKKDLENWRDAIGAPVPTEANPDFDAEAEAKAIESAFAKAAKKEK